MKRYVSILTILISTILIFLALLVFFQFAGTVRAQSQERLPSSTRAQSPAVQASAFKPTLVCTECHGQGKTLPYLGGAVFHSDAHQAYGHGYHAKAIQNGSKAASCLDCHAVNGDMTMMLPKSDPRSTINRVNIAKMCGSCHGDKSVMAGTGISNRPFLAYQESAHARAIAQGNAGAAVCTDCHNSHDILPASDAGSPIFKSNIPKTCAKCHSSIAVEFTESVHGQAAARGVSQSPVCTDCHGIHSIKPRTDARSALGTTACAQCHEGVKLSQEFGVPGGRVSSYEDSYHGLARKFGSKVAADCASCHGVHNIRPSSDPVSMINQANLVHTCGQCHPGAGEKFIMGKIHLDAPASTDIGTVTTGWVRRIYLALIGVTIGAMALHNILVWRKKFVQKQRAQNRTILRMTKRQRYQHWLLLVSFVALVVTGFALKYPDTWLGAMLGTSEAFRRTGHRIAGVAMMAVGLYHVFYVLMTKEGRQGLFDLLPRKKDISDVAHNLSYYLGLSSTKPKLAKFGYGEKAEYWAVVWGTLIMGLTGMMVWFKVEMFGFLPRWIIDVALAVHWYEAILATLAILVWHIYNVIFDPDVYPLNYALVDGRVSEEYYKEEHELDYEQMMEAKAKEQAKKDKSQPEERGQSKDKGLSPSPAHSSGD